MILILYERKWAWNVLIFFAAGSVTGGETVSDV